MLDPNLPDNLAGAPGPDPANPEGGATRIEDYITKKSKWKSK